MGMSIDEAIGELQKLKLPISKHDLSFHFVEYTRNETLDMAIDTMRKYQQIVNIVSLNDEEFKQCGLKELKEILEVIADGNVD